jgi:hypothetical protein
MTMALIFLTPPALSQVRTCVYPHHLLLPLSVQAVGHARAGSYLLHSQNTMNHGP